MKTQSLLLLVGAVTLAAGTALVARALMQPPPPQIIVKEVEVAAPPAKLVLVSNRDIAPGEFIDGRSLTWRNLPSGSVGATYLTSDSESERAEMERKLYGATPRQQIIENEPVTREMLIRSGEPGFIPAVLGAGMRAVSIPTDTVASNAGLVAAGDKVDVILSLNRENAAISSEAAGKSGGLTALAAQTIVRGVRVLALNRETSSLAPVTVTTGAEATTASPRHVSYESITLEVRPGDAERLAVAREVGTLQIALRDVHPGASHTDDRYAPSSVTRLSDVTTVLHFATAEAPKKVNTFHGTTQGQKVFGGAQ